jgi:hypothetical protein
MLFVSNLTRCETSINFFSRFQSWRRQTTVLLSVFALVAIPSVAYLAAITWTNNLVDSGFTSAMMFVVDLDGDLDMDIVGIGRTPDDVAWYRNDGSESFTKVTIDSNAPGVRDVDVGDIDNDGDIDILISQVDGTPDGVYWYDNDGSENFTKRTISTLDNPIYVGLADVNEDGELDVLATAWSLGDVVYYENLGGTPSTFSTTLIDDNLTGPDDIDAADIDGDGDIDIITTHGSTSVQFYENDGAENFTEKTFASILASSATYGLHLEDIDGDTDIDMIVAGSAGIHYYDSNGADDPTFTRSTVYSTGAQSDIDVADFDGDGDKDIVGSYETSSSLIRWFENDGSESFTTATVDSAVTYPWKVDAGDIDGDGRPDILVGSNQGIEWWENGAVTTSTSTGGGRAAHQRRKKMIQQMRSGIYTYEDTEAPSLASVGIFDHAEQAAVHAAAAGSGSTVEEEEDDSDDDDQASTELPPMIVQTGFDPIGTEQVARIARLHNRHMQNTQIVAVAEAEEEVTGEVVYESSQHQRVCERVERRFGDNLTMIDRINIRIQKRFGWHC